MNSYHNCHVCSAPTCWNLLHIICALNSQCFTHSYKKKCVVFKFNLPNGFFNGKVNSSRCKQFNRSSILKCLWLSIRKHMIEQKCISLKTSGNKNLKKREFCILKSKDK